MPGMGPVALYSRLSLLPGWGTEAGSNVQPIRTLKQRSTPGPGDQTSDIALPACSDRR